MSVHAQRAQLQLQRYRERSERLRRERLDRANEAIRRWRLKVRFYSSQLELFTERAPKASE